MVLRGNIRMPNPWVIRREKKFSRQFVWRSNQFMTGRARNTWFQGKIDHEKEMQIVTEVRRNQKKWFMGLQISRMESQLHPHNLSYESFTDNLEKMQVLLGKKMVANLSIYEPRTFKCLMVLSQNRAAADGEALPETARILPDNTVLGNGEPFKYPR